MRGGRVVPALAAAMLLGACTQPPADTPAHRRDAPTPSASPATSAPAPHRLLVRPARFRLPAPLAREAVVGAGCHAIVAGGLVVGDSSTATASRIDLRSGRVGPLPPLAVPVHDTAGVPAARPLVIGGGNAAEQSVVQAWDGAGWRVVGHLPQARSDLVAAVVAGRVVVAGGYDGARPAEPDILASADGGTWRVDGVLPVPVRYPASAVVGGTIWLFGGESAGVTRSAIQRIDPATGRARLVGRLPRALAHAVAMPFGPRILIAGGRVAANAVSDRLWWFDTRTGAVTAAGRLPYPLADSALARCGGTDYLLGGETPALTDRVLRVTYR